MTTPQSPSRRTPATLVGLTLALSGLLGCFRSPDIAVVKCRDDRSCPSGYYCAVPGQAGGCRQRSGGSDGGQQSDVANPPSDLAEADTPNSAEAGPKLDGNAHDFAPDQDVLDGPPADAIEDAPVSGAEVLSETGGIVGTGGTGGTTGGTSSVAFEQEMTWGDVASDSVTGSLQVGPTLGPSYILIGIAAAATSTVPGVHVVSVTGAGLSFSRLAGGNVSGSAFCAEFWGARSSAPFAAQPLTVTLSEATYVGMVAWSLTGVSVASPVGATSVPRQSIDTTYLESITNTQRGSMLFGAFFDGDDHWAAIAPSAGTLVRQTNLAYFLYSSSARDGGAQSLEARLVDPSIDVSPPDKWTIYRAAVEIVP